MHEARVRLVWHFDLELDPLARQRALHERLDDAEGLLADDVGNALAGDGLRRHAESFRIHAVDEDVAPLAIAMGEQHGGVLRDEAEFRARGALTERRVRSFARAACARQQPLKYRPHAPSF